MALFPPPPHSAPVQREDSTGTTVEEPLRAMEVAGVRALSTVLTAAVVHVGSALGPGDRSARVALLTSQHRTWRLRV